MVNDVYIRFAEDINPVYKRKAILVTQGHITN